MPAGGSRPLDHERTFHQVTCNMDSPVDCGYPLFRGREDLERKLATILASDIVGRSRLMGDDQANSLAALQSYRLELFDTLR